MNIVSLSVFPFGQDELCEFLLEHSKSVFWLKVKIRLGCKGVKNSPKYSHCQEFSRGKTPDADLYFIHRSAFVQH